MATFPATVAVPEPPAEISPSPGVLTATESTLEKPDPTNQRLDDRLKNALRTLARMADQRDSYSYMWAVNRALKARMYLRGNQHLIWDNDQKRYLVAPQVGGDTNASDEPTSRQSFNIYLGYAKSFMATFAQNQAAVRMESADPRNAVGIRGAEAAQKYIRIYDKFNPGKEQQVEIARFLWTDGKCVAYTREVFDGQRFGFEENAEVGEQPEGVDPLQGAQAINKRVPRGREITSFYGTLETKFPATARTVSDCGYFKLSQEQDISQIKSDYQEQAKNLSAGTRGGSESQMARNGRIATAEGVESYGGGDKNHLLTKDFYWFRPSWYANLEDDLRKDILGTFPDGCFVAMCADTYLESRNESMDDHVKVMFALPGDGSNRTPIGDPEIAVQEEFNDGVNLAIETFKYGVPSTWIDEENVDIDAVQKQASEPGNHLPMKRKPGEALADNFFQEQPAQSPADLVRFLDNLQGPLSQFLTGQQPALFGGEMNDNKTASGYSMARDQAMGLMTLVWVPYKKFRADIVLDAVKCAARSRQNDIVESVPKEGSSRDRETLTIPVDDLKGGIVATPDTDENFPESWTQKSNKFMGLLQEAGANPVMGAVLQHPDNIALAKQMIGLEDLTVPGADSRDKQLQEIEDMRKVPPVPDPQAIQMAEQAATQNGAILTPEMIAQLPLTSSIAIDPEVDDSALEYAECKRWLNGSEGQKAKQNEPQWYQNVRLHMLAHKAEMDKAQQGAGQGKPPSTSISFSDLPPDGQVQLAAQAGLQIQPPPPMPTGPGPQITQ
jgi:hypothetical protein